MKHKITNFINEMKRTHSFEHLVEIKLLKEKILKDIDELYWSTDELNTLNFNDFEYLGDFEDRVEELADNIKWEIDHLIEDYSIILENYKNSDCDSEESDEIKIRIVSELLELLNKLL